MPDPPCGGTPGNTGVTGDDTGGSGGSSVNLLDTISNASLRNNVKANCVYQSLKANTVFKEMISAYLSNKTYKLEFKVDSLPDNATNGITTSNSNYTNGKVYITINSTDIDNRFAFEVAKTYIHEAYHAYITQILIENGGPFGLYYSKADFNKDISEIFDAYINYGVDQQRTDAYKRGVVFDDNLAQHTVMAGEIDKIANGVKEYVESKFPAIKDNPNITMDNYRAEAWRIGENRGF